MVAKLWQPRPARYATAQPGPVGRSERIKSIHCTSAAPVTLTEDLSELSQAVHVSTQPDFLQPQLASSLRATYDENFANPQTVKSSNFCWDYWHVPGQYTQMRTPAQEYFDPQQYAQLETALLDFGEDRLGCIGITPIWLSYYIDAADGCQQELHCDNVHGPWAFVLSLTQWSTRAFSGGETFMLSDFALDFWNSFAADEVIQRDTLTRTIEPHFNQLTVFDPRIPHGVREVKGVQEPARARVALHGWFVEPEAYIEGALEEVAALEALEEVLMRFGAVQDKLPAATGTFVLRATVRANGSVADVRFVMDTLKIRPSGRTGLSSVQARAYIQGEAVIALRSQWFPRANGNSTVTFPITFE